MADGDAGKPSDLADFLDGRKSAVKVMIAIAEAQLIGNPIGANTLWKKIGGSKTTIWDRIIEWEQMNFIQRVREETYPYRKNIALTEKGHQLIAIIALLKNWKI